MIPTREHIEGKRFMEQFNTPKLHCLLFSIRKASMLVILVYIFILLAGCSSFNCTKLENLLGGNTNLVQLSYTITDNLVQRATPPLIPGHPDMPVMVTTFVDNNDLQQTSRFGRIIQEHAASRLVQLGYTVREMKLTSMVRMEPQSGETILSRDLSLLKGEQQVQAVLAGTISMTNRKMYISARLINPINNNIIATDDYQLCMDDDILSMFGLQRMPSAEQPVEEPSKPFLNSIL